MYKELCKLFFSNLLQEYSVISLKTFSQNHFRSFTMLSYEYNLIYLSISHIWTFRLPQVSLS